MAVIQPQNLDLKQTGIAITDKVMVTDSNNVTKIVSGAAIIEIAATCNEAADKSVKVIKLTDYTDTVLPDFCKIHVLFTYGNTVGDGNTSYPQFQIKNKNDAYIVDPSTGATLTFAGCDSRGHYAGTGCWNAQDYMTFKRLGQKLLIQNSDIRLSQNGYITMADGTTVYNKQSVDSSLANYYQKVKIKRTTNNFNNITVAELNSLVGKPTQNATVIYDCFQSTNMHFGTLIVGKLSEDYGYAHFFGYYGNGSNFFRYDGSASVKSWVQIS